MSKTIVFSRHACDRIAERGADWDFVEKVALNGVRRSRLDSIWPDRVILTAHDDRNIAWSVICNIECTHVITVREANQKERENYEKTFGT